MSDSTVPKIRNFFSMTLFKTNNQITNRQRTTPQVRCWYFWPASIVLDVIVKHSVRVWIRYLYALSTSISTNCAWATAVALAAALVSKLTIHSCSGQIAIKKRNTTPNHFRNWLVVVPFREIPHSWNIYSDEISTVWQRCSKLSNLEIWPNPQHSSVTGG